MTEEDATNLPWYPSVDPFEHYNSGRTHCYAGATFGGSFEAGMENQVRVRDVVCPIPTPYNVAVREEDELFVYGGGYGDVGFPPGPPGSLVVKLNAEDLSVQWWQQLSLTRDTGQWDYPGVVAVHRNKMVYAIYIDRLTKLDPETGAVLGTALLPALSAEEDTGCNGFTGLPDGTIVTKNLSRQNGCYEQGFSAFTQCPDPSAIPDTMLCTVDPDSLEVLDTVKGPEPASGRISATRYKGVDYVYLVGFQNIYRYRAELGKLVMDEGWGPISYLQEGQTPASAISVINDYVVFNTNASPATAPMSVWAFSQENDEIRDCIEPFDDKDGQDSFLPAMVSTDPDNGRVYAMNSGTGQLAAIDLDPDGKRLMAVDWMVEQYSFGFMSLVGPRDRRVLVASDIPRLHLADATYMTSYRKEQVVWRAAEGGGELARSPLLPAMSQGAALSPGAKGAIYYPGAHGQVVELAVAPP